ncbi:MAG: T9SS type A sorting domain-containing protein [Lewinellaceae bacterium]|nr:T9SS type A sorting domain-containing protein [Lewinellaceae bacterium]
MVFLFALCSVQVSTNDQAQSADLDLRALPVGVYLLKVRTEERTYTQKILVQK